MPTGYKLVIHLISADRPRVVKSHPLLPDGYENWTRYLSGRMRLNAGILLTHNPKIADVLQPTAFSNVKTSFSALTETQHYVLILDSNRNGAYISSFKTSIEILVSVLFLILTNRGFHLHPRFSVIRTPTVCCSHYKIRFFQANHYFSSTVKGAPQFLNSSSDRVIYGCCFLSQRPPFRLRVNLLPSNQT